jgi:hypothetical protein
MTYLDIYNIEGAGRYPSTMFIGIIVVAIIITIIFWTLMKKSDSNTTTAPIAPVIPAVSAGLPVATPVVSAELPVATPAVSAELPVATPAVSAELPAISAELPAISAESSVNRLSVEGFTNDLPYQEKNESMKLYPEDDYSDVLQKMSLDNNVFKQHNQYVTDRNKITSTASYIPARSDTQDIVTTWGLARRSLLPMIDPSAREVPSQNPEQGSKPIQLRWN